MQYSRLGNLLAGHLAASRQSMKPLLLLHPARPAHPSPPPPQQVPHRKKAPPLHRIRGHFQIFLVRSEYMYLLYS